MTPTQAQIEAAAEALGEVQPTHMLTLETRLSLAGIALTTAAKAGEQNLREDYKNMTASRDRLWQEKRELEAATIERCAQVAWEQLWRDHRGIAEKVVAAVRALKE